jgi:hypothetical protein
MVPSSVLKMPANHRPLTGVKHGYEPARVKPLDWVRRDGVWYGHATVRTVAARGFRAQPGAVVVLLLLIL